MSDVQAAVDAALREHDRRRRRGLLWQVPVFLLAGAALGAVAVAVSGGERALVVAAVAMSAVVATLLGVLLAAGGAVPRWEVRGEALPARLLVVGGLAGLGAWVAAFAGFLLLG